MLHLNRDAIPSPEPQKYLPKLTPLKTKNPSPPLERGPVFNAKKILRSLNTSRLLSLDTS